MNADLYQRACDVFAEVRGADPEARAARAHELCADDEALLREVLALLGFDSDDSFLSAPPAPASLAESDPRTIGPYRVLGRLGEGGFAVVYLAEQSEPLRRRVALKLLKAGMDSRAVLARFESERQALALMSHPNVAQVYDAGLADDGRPWFAMERIAGDPITHYCAREKVDLEGRLRLFIDVCEAVQHAHQKGVIHRDLKPSNILVTAAEGPPAVKVIDFGIAKAISQPLSDTTVYTAQGQLIGTPGYMSPEQAEMSGVDIDTRTDVYALGALLYELLTGALPHDPETLRKCSFAEMQRLIREVDPPPPSARLQRDAGRRGPARRIERELDWIVMRAMEKDRTRRYAAASALGADVRRYLSREPVEAGPPTTIYRLRKLVSRHRPAAIASAAIALTLLATTAITLAALLRAEDARRRALVEAELSRDALAFLTETVLQANLPPQLGVDPPLSELLAYSAGQLEAWFPDRPRVRAQILTSVADSYLHLERYDDAHRALADAWAICEQIGEADGAIGLRVRYQQAQLAFHRGDHRGLAMAREALDTAVASLGTAHEVTLDLTELIGHAHVLMRRSPEAIALYEQTLRAVIAEAGESSSAAAKAQWLLGVALKEQPDQLARAESLLRRSIAPRSEPRAGADTLRRTAREHLVDCLVRQERYGDAVQEGLSLWADLSARHGEDSFETGRVLYFLGQAHRGAGQLDEAIEYLERGRQVHLALHGPDHFSCARDAQELARVCLEAQRFAEAAGYAQQAIDYARSSPQSRSVSLRGALFSLGQARLGAGELDAAEAALVEAFALYADAPQSRVRIAESLAALCERSQRPADATEWRARAAEAGGGS